MESEEEKNKEEREAGKSRNEGRQIGAGMGARKNVTWSAGSRCQVTQGTITVTPIRMLLAGIARGKCSRVDLASGLTVLEW